MSAAWDMLVYRDGRQTCSGRALLEACAAELCGPAVRVPHALLRAGELECALSDVSPDATLAAQVTDALADALVQKSTPRITELLPRLLQIEPPLRVTLSAPEGFAYYALHPLDFADLVRKLEVRSPHACVIGIRSIGTTLSAVAAAQLRAAGCETVRFTVRPEGHPFQRSAGFLDRQVRTVQQMMARDALFFVVDEGPGISGSSLLSVAEALLGAGVPRRNIELLHSRATDGGDLSAPNACARWRGFRSSCVAPPARLPADRGLNLSGGQWRALLYSSAENWPPMWPQSERLKFLSRDGRRFYKFEGLGHYGDSNFARAAQLAEAGFAPGVEQEGDGFVAYDFITGPAARPALETELSVDVLRRMADYCAFRARHCSAEPLPVAALEEMARHNFAREFGRPTELALAIERPVIADNRMAPHEWIAQAGPLLKTDGAGDGADHFYPGPTDIAWDLAGAIVEWQMPDEAAAVLVSEYSAFAGDNIASRLPDFIVAYAAFRLGLARMAALSTPPEEQRRWNGAAARYREVLARPRALPLAA